MIFTSSDFVHRETSTAARFLALAICNVELLVGRLTMAGGIGTAEWAARSVDPLPGANDEAAARLVAVAFNLLSEAVAVAFECWIFRWNSQRQSRDYQGESCRTRVGLIVEAHQGSVYDYACLEASNVRCQLRSEPVQRRRIRPPVEELVEAGLEHGLVRSHVGEQRHRGVEFAVVGTVEDVAGRLVAVGGDEARAFAQAWAEHGVGQVGGGFVGGTDRIGARHFAPAQPANLGEHEPHPVGTLFAGAQLGQDIGIHGILGPDEAVEVKFIVHGSLPRSFMLPLSQDLLKWRHHDT